MTGPGTKVSKVRFIHCLSLVTDLDVVASVIITAFSEQSMSHCSFWIESIQNRVRILETKRSSEGDTS